MKLFNKNTNSSSRSYQFARTNVATVNLVIISGLGVILIILFPKSRKIRNDFDLLQTLKMFVLVKSRKVKTFKQVPRKNYWKYICFILLVFIDIQSWNVMR